MNFARIIVTKGFSALSIGRTVSRTEQLLTSTTYFRHYSSRSTKEVDSTAQQWETSALSVPTNRWAHSIASAANAAEILKKRTSRKKRNGKGFDEYSAQGFFNVSAFSSAEEYDLEALLNGLTQQKLYTAKKFFSTDNLGVEQDVLYVRAKYQVGEEPRDIFFFREGSVVLWNFNEIETNNVLSFLRPYEKEPYLSALVRGESEVMPYTYIPESAIDVEGDLVAESDCEVARAFFHNGKFFLTSGDSNFLQKYTFSNAVATSIKLGIWEATLDRFIDSIEYWTDDLKKGRRIRISRAEALRKTGELFALRHVINLSSDLLDTPDFYWDREELEALYSQVCSYFSCSRRTKVMNEKISHCVELAELISHNLNDKHHIRLEWMIIILIMVEVGFEIVHYMDRYSSKDEIEGIHIPDPALDVEGDLVVEADIEASSAFFHNGKFFLTCADDNFLQKYTFSNAMATSVKLGIWEATLDRFINSTEHWTSHLKGGQRIRLSRADALRKTGELFALRHVINLSSDLLDTPDFYWDREELEALYTQVCTYFSISRRTNVMNEKISHCVELAELISGNLNDKHHVRLEWMVIILIVITVGFEFVHYMDRYKSIDETKGENN